MGFKNRLEAGRRLGGALMSHRGPDLLILALPRGGVPVGSEVARTLEAPLDVLIVRKVGVPWAPELAAGAVAAGGVLVLNQRVLRELPLAVDELESAVHAEQAEVARRERVYRGTRPLPEVTGKTVILVDDGLATGSTMRAAVQVMRKLSAGKIVVAVPVAPEGTVRELRKEADEVVVLEMPSPFVAVGQAYSDFSQLTDREVHALLDAA